MSRDTKWAQSTADFEVLYMEFFVKVSLVTDSNKKAKLLGGSWQSFTTFVYFNTRFLVLTG